MLIVQLAKIKRKLTYMKINKIAAMVAAAVAMATLPVTAANADEGAGSEPTIYRTYIQQNYRQATPLVENLNGINTQPTQAGREISDLTLHNGRLYVGYGDYTANTGPIDLYSYDANTGASRLDIKVPTEDIDIITEVNGKLVVPYIDPRAEWSSPVGYASNKSGTWQNYDQAKMIHNYDMATTNGTNLFMAGSLNLNGRFYAVIWYSPNGVDKWQIIRKVTSPANRDELDRYYWMEVINGKLYAAADIAGTRTLDVWDNGVWTSKTLSPEASSALNVSEADHIVSIGDKLITKLPNPKGAGENEMGTSIYSITENRVLNPSETTVDAQGGVLNLIDFNKVGNTVYGMASNGAVYSTTDGVNWKYLVTSSVMGSVFSIDEANKKLYIGRSNTLNGTDNGIYVVNLPANGKGNTPPEVNVPNEKVVLTVGDTWDPMAGVTATDAEDGDVSASIQQYGNVDTSTPGDYYHVYGASDSNAAGVQVALLITVVPAEEKVTTQQAADAAHKLISDTYKASGKTAASTVVNDLNKNSTNGIYYTAIDDSRSNYSNGDEPVWKAQAEYVFKLMPSLYNVTQIKSETPFDPAIATGKGDFFCIAAYHANGEQVDEIAFSGEGCGPSRPDSFWMGG